MSTPTKRDFLIALFHAVGFYVLLLATIPGQADFVSWLLQLTTWIFVLSYTFYVLLIYTYHTKNPGTSINNASNKAMMSMYYTIVSIMNLTVTFYFWAVLYPPQEQDMVSYAVIMYSYPALTVAINIMVQLHYTKDFQFGSLDGAILFFSINMAMSGAAYYIEHRSFEVESQDAQTIWIDFMNLQKNIYFFITQMALSYIQLKILYKIIEFWKNYSHNAAEALNLPA